MYRKKKKFYIMEIFYDKINSMLNKFNFYLEKNYIVNTISKRIYKCVEKN